MPRPDLHAAAAAATDFLAAQTWTGVPVDPFELARRAEIPVKAIDTTDFSGCLMRRGERFAIFYSTAIQNDGFRRFTLSHELGHHELTHHHTHLFSAGEVHTSQSNYVSNEWFEREADTFASELLMPANVFESAIRRTVLGLPAVKTLADQFGTSLTSTAIRYAGLSPDPVAIVVSGGGMIAYCFTSPCMRKIRADYIKKDTPIPPSSTTFKMLKAGEREAEGESYLSAWFDRPARELKFAEDVIDLGRYGRTLTVLHARQLPDEQEWEDQAADEDPEADKFNRDGKRIRF